MEIQRLLQIQKVLIPEGLESIVKRYHVLRAIMTAQPIGRRALSSSMAISERVLRGEIEKLREAGMIEVESAGMCLSVVGQELIKEVEWLVHRIKGLTELEEAIKQKLGIQDICIVEGDYDLSETVKRDLGRKAADLILKNLTHGMSISVMGGTTLACVANEMKNNKKFKNMMVVPGRGGLGERLEIQANSIAAKIAHKLGANYKLLHVPDNIGCDVLESLKSNKQIKEVLDEIKRIDMIIFSIGTAKEMADRRGLSELRKDELRMKKAFAEALGYYFNQEGEPVMHTDSVGIVLQDLPKIKHAICAVAGKHKAAAIHAFSKYYTNYLLVTDEVTAKEILKL